ncbi:uncharacterized protein TNCV_964091 [Trichonephila clavipes]|nr:uncharacterized protein TNCV_964091 [Trichonephila clavipes]
MTGPGESTRSAMVINTSQPYLGKKFHNSVIHQENISKNFFSNFERMMNVVAKRRKDASAPVFFEERNNLWNLNSREFSEEIGLRDCIFLDDITDYFNDLYYRLYWVAAVAEWYRYWTVACFVTGSSPVPLKTRRVGQRCTLNLSRAETSSRWCGVEVRRGGASSGVVHVT